MQLDEGAAPIVRNATTSLPARFDLLSSTPLAARTQLDEASRGVTSCLRIATKTEEVKIYRLGSKRWFPMSVWFKRRHHAHRLMLAPYNAESMKHIQQHPSSVFMSIFITCYCLASHRFVACDSTSRASLPYCVFDLFICQYRFTSIAIHLCACVLFLPVPI